MGEVYDFTEFKLHQLMERAALAHRDDTADWYFHLLNEYLAGNIAISFENGLPIIVWPEP
jgi:hypothetical protein